MKSNNFQYIFAFSIMLSNHFRVKKDVGVLSHTTSAI